MRLDPLANNISQFQKSKMVVAAIFKKIITQYLHNRLNNFDEIWNVDACQPSGFWQSMKFKNPRWWQWPFGKSKSRNISAMDGPVTRKFDMVMCINPPDLLSI